MAAAQQDDQDEELELGQLGRLDQLAGYSGYQLQLHEPRARRQRDQPLSAPLAALKPPELGRPWGPLGPPGSLKPLHPRGDLPLTRGSGLWLWWSWWEMEKKQHRYYQRRRCSPPGRPMENTEISSKTLCSGMSENSLDKSVWHGYQTPAYTAEGRISLCVSQRRRWAWCLVSRNMVVFLLFAMLASTTATLKSTCVGQGCREGGACRCSSGLCWRTRYSECTYFYQYSKVYSVAITPPWRDCAIRHSRILSGCSPLVTGRLAAVRCRPPTCNVVRRAGRARRPGSSVMIPGESGAADSQRFSVRLRERAAKERSTWDLLSQERLVRDGFARG